MGLDDFTVDIETSSPKTNMERSKDGVDEYIKNSQQEEIEIPGGFTIPNNDQDDKDTEVVKIFGGPGTGKTTTMVGNTEIENFKGILQRMFEERSPKDVMLVAYTRAAADEAKRRLVQLTDVSKSKADDRITTIHSTAMKFNGLTPKDIVEIRWNKDKYNFCQQVGLEYKDQYEDDQEQMLSTPDDEGHLFFKVLSWLKSKLKKPEEYLDCPLGSEWKRSSEEFVKFAELWEEYKNNKGIWEFDDAILECVNNRDTIDTKYLFVDEVQDLYPLQQAFLDNHFGRVDRIFLAGDDDQCLPPTAPVELRNEHGLVVQKEIQEVEVGDRVQSMYGSGDYGYRRVTDVTVKDVVDKGFKTFITESGKKITVTDNHKLFTRIPEAEYDTESDVHYVYLMRDDSGRWRIGETDNLHQRLNVERNARCIVPVEVCDSRKEALLKESQYSLNYSIPTTTFTQREGEVLSEESVKSTLYNNIEMGLVALQNDLGVDLSKPPLFKKATTRGRTESLNLNINMCSDMRNGYVGHKFEVHTSNEEYVNELQTLDILNSTQRRGDNWRFRKMSSDLSMLGDLSEHIQEGLAGDVITQMKPTKRRQNAYVVPASNVVEGMLVPVLDNEEVVFEEVVEVEEFQETTEVYDLTVDGTHNFSSNGVFTHNTIYEWAGAKPEYFLDMEGKVNDEMPELWEDKTGYWDSEGTYILDQSWRMPNNVLEMAKMAIEPVSDRQEKQIKPHHEGGEFIPLQSPDPSRVINLINPDDTMVLFRAKYQMSNFGDKLIEAGIPYTDRFKTWKSNVTKLRDGIAKLKNGEDTLTGGEASRIIEELPDGALDLDYSRDSVVDKLSSTKTVPSDAVLSAVRYEKPTDRYKLQRWLREFRTDDMNWYRERAVRNNLLKDNEHLSPSGVEIETIHGSKGQEADTIILSTDTTESVLDNMQQGTLNDAERRLYYVGVTRTKNRLVMCEGLDEDSPHIRLDTIFGQEWRDKYTFMNRGQDVHPEL
jgi:superfamily I DNA/RNA helicase